MRPTMIRVSEINIRPGEPEAQPVIRRLRNLGVLIQASLEGNLNEVKPEVRTDQLAMCSALVTGPDGTATVTAELPDSLTTYRITAIADLEDRFGKGDRV